MAIGRGSTCPMTITRLTMETRRLMAIRPLRRGAPPAASHRAGCPNGADAPPRRPAAESIRGACGVFATWAAAVRVFCIAVRPRYLRFLAGKTRSPGSSIIPTGCISADCDRAASSRCIRAPLDCAPSLPGPSRLWRDDHLLSHGTIGIR